MGSDDLFGLENQQHSSLKQKEQKNNNQTILVGLLLTWKHRRKKAQRPHSVHCMLLSSERQEMAWKTSYPINPESSKLP